MQILEIYIHTIIYIHIHTYTTSSTTTTTATHHHPHHPHHRGEGGTPPPTTTHHHPHHRGEGGTGALLYRPITMGWGGGEVPSDAGPYILPIHYQSCSLHLAQPTKDQGWVPLTDAFRPNLGMGKRRKSPPVRWGLSKWHVFLLIFVFLVATEGFLGDTFLGGVATEGGQWKVCFLGFSSWSLFSKLF